MGNGIRLYPSLSVSWTIRGADGICVSSKPHLKIFCLLRILPTRQMSCCIAVWSRWAVQKWLNWNLIFFHLSHYGQIESPAAVLWPGIQSRVFWVFFFFFLGCNLTASENVTFCCLDALPSTWVIHAVASAPVGLWSFTDLPFSPGHHPWHCPVSWCQYDIMGLKSLMCSSRHKATFPSF